MPSQSLQEEMLQVTLTVPKNVAQHIREQVEAGVYSNPSEYIESVLLSESLFEPIDQDRLTNWINTEGVRRLEAMKADPSSGLTIDEAFAGLIDEDDEDA